MPRLLPAGKPLLVTGRTSTRNLAKNLLGHLKGTGCVLFEEAEENPSSNTVEKGIALYRKERCSYVIGFGGGSPLDCGKAIALLARSRASVLDVMYKRAEVKEKTAPFIAVPTTAGTGSEVTPYSIITDTKEKKKLSIAHTASYPVHAVVDPELTVSMPGRITASTGLDALSHAFESAWSKTANGVSEACAIVAIGLVFKHLANAYNDGNNKTARTEMMRASLLAGLAISNTGTTINHSISYPLTLFRNVPHGFACALSLPAVMRYNREAASPVLARICAACGCASIDDLIEKTAGLLAALGCPRSLGDLNIAESDLDWLTVESYTKNHARNPRPLKKEDMRELLRTML